ncbi:MAG: hypothetical protein J4G14_02485 [Dehalococcoidia bacterium]|nr:hypothetical protein [Dehalococcoidia bacterium]
MGKQNIQVLILSPDQRYRTVNAQRSYTIPALLETKLGKGEKGGFVDDLRSPTVWSQYGAAYMDDPKTLLEADRSEYPSAIIWSQAHGAAALDGSGLLLSTDTTLRDSKPTSAGKDDDWMMQVADIQRGMIQSEAQQEAVAGASRDQSRADLLDRLIWILAIVALVVAGLTLIFLGPKLLSTFGDIGSSISVPGVGI